MKEYTMTINEINRPTILEGNDAIYTLLVRLLLLEPGTNQVFPDMGVGLISKYRYALSDKIPTLVSDYKDQILKYIPEVQMVDIDASIKGTTLILKVNVDNEIIYLFNVDTNNMTLEDL